MINRFTLLIFLFFSFFNSFAQDWSDMNKIVASDRAAEDQYGNFVAIDGDYAVVGSPFDDEDQDNLNTLTNAGSAYVYKRIDNIWVQQQKLVASNRVESDLFGFKVGISGDYIIISSPYGNLNGGGGAVYIFKKNGEIWQEQQVVVGNDINSGNVFGADIDIDGDYIIVGSHFNNSDASGGNVLDNAGAAYIFVRDGSIWLQQQKIVASDRAFDDRFGLSVSIDGEYAIVGAYFEDEDSSGANTLEGSGSAYIFKRDGFAWSEQQKITSEDRSAGDQFGNSVAISGDNVIVGAVSERENENGQNPMTLAGSAYIFNRTDVVWTQQKKLVASDRSSFSQYGYSVAINGDYALVGAIWAVGKNNTGFAGSAYLYKKTENTWGDEEKIVAIDASAANDSFGSSVGLTNEYAIISAFYEAEDENGTNTFANAGSAYLYKNCSIDTSIAITETELTSNFSEGGIAYQWMDCDNGDTPIDGAINQSYSPTVDGNYSVEISRVNGCVIVSECVNFESLSVTDFNISQLTIFPNPALNVITINLGNNSTLPDSYSVYNNLGQIITEKKISNENDLKINVSTYNAGIYFIKLSRNNTSNTLKLIVQ